MDLSILIVNYNGASFIANCLDSIFDSQTAFKFEVIVLDNDSQDESLLVLDGFKDRITLIAHPQNVGFSKGNNIAFEAAKGRYVFLLNNDTVLSKTTLDMLLGFAQKQSDFGAIAPKLLNEDGSLQAPGSSLGKWQFRRKTPCKVRFIAGAAVLFKREVYEQMGGLDEQLFFYNDDIDMCKSLLGLGYDIYYYPLASLTHFGGLSTRTRRLGSLIEGYRGGLYIAHKHYSILVYHLYRWLLFLDIGPRCIIHGIISLVNRSHWAYVKAYLTIMRISIRQEIRANLD
ncbi:MAG: hypothetical protein CL521_01970 [Actinobacteria bacterium]|nr:hypothetical protein [Actinomycetota bacterium]